MSLLGIDDFWCIEESQNLTLQGNFYSEVFQYVTSFDDPIKHTISDEVYYTFLPQFRKDVNLFLQKQQATLRDSIFHSRGDRYSMFKIDKVQEYLQRKGDEEDTFASFYLRKDNK